MKFTKESEKLLSFFLNDECIDRSSLSEKMKNVLAGLHSDLLKADQYIHTLKKQMGPRFYSLKVTKISSAIQIPKPTSTSGKYFPSQIKNHVDNSSEMAFSYTFSLFHRTIKIHFISEDKYADLKIEEYNHNVDAMLKWLYIINEHASSRCSKTLNVYIYLSTFKKTLPESNIEILDATHVNTAYTVTCRPVSDIVIYRKEEWFKVFIHETFHNFGLDFSDMHTDQCNKRILDIFKVKSDVNLFEAYTEFWARLVNVLFCSYYHIDDRSDVKSFIHNASYLFSIEQKYSLFQMVKTLDFMGLKYKDLYSKTSISKNLRDTLYGENTNVLSYYIISTILMTDYMDFLLWCNKNNMSLMQFKKTPGNIESLCDYIECKYKSKWFLDQVKCMQRVHLKLKKGSHSDTNLYDLANTMRMAICELE